MAPLEPNDARVTRSQVKRRALDTEGLQDAVKTKSAKKPKNAGAKGATMTQRVESKTPKKGVKRAAESQPDRLKKPKKPKKADAEGVGDAQPAKPANAPWPRVQDLLLLKIYDEEKSKEKPTLDEAIVDRFNKESLERGFEERPFHGCRSKIQCLRPMNSEYKYSDEIKAYLFSLMKRNVTPKVAEELYEEEAMKHEPKWPPRNRKTIGQFFRRHSASDVENAKPSTPGSGKVSAHWLDVEDNILRGWFEHSHKQLIEDQKCLYQFMLERGSPFCYRSLTAIESRMAVLKKRDGYVKPVAMDLESVARTAPKKGRKPSTANKVQVKETKKTKKTKKSKKANARSRRVDPSADDIGERVGTATVITPAQESSLGEWAASQVASLSFLELLVGSQLVLSTDACHGECPSPDAIELGTEATRTETPVDAPTASLSLPRAGSIPYPGDDATVALALPGAAGLSTEANESISLTAATAADDNEESPTVSVVVASPEAREADVLPGPSLKAATAAAADANEEAPTVSVASREVDVMQSPSAERFAALVLLGSAGLDGEPTAGLSSEARDSVVIGHEAALDGDAVALSSEASDTEPISLEVVHDGDGAKDEAPTPPVSVARNTIVATGNGAIVPRLHDPTASPLISSAAFLSSITPEMFQPESPFRSFLLRLKEREDSLNTRRLRELVPVGLYNVYGVQFSPTCVREMLFAIAVLSQDAAVKLIFLRELWNSNLPASYGKCREQRCCLKYDALHPRYTHTGRCRHLKYLQRTEVILDGIQGSGDYRLSLALSTHMEAVWATHTGQGASCSAVAHVHVAGLWPPGHVLSRLGQQQHVQAPKTGVSRHDRPLSPRGRGGRKWLGVWCA